MTPGEEPVGVRVDWACEIRNVFKTLAGDATEGPARLGAVMHRLKTGLPAPANAVESLLLRLWLVLLLQRLGATVHEHFHAQFGPAECSLTPPVPPEPRWLDGTVPLATLFDEWQREYTAWFERHHHSSPVVRVQQLLQQRFAESSTLASIAREVGMSRTTLSEQFTRVFGIGPSAYRWRVRTREAVVRLRHSSVSVDDIARQVGYQSTSKFYRRLRRDAGLTPAQIRDLQDHEFDSLLATRLSLRQRTAADRRADRRGSAEAADRRMRRRRLSNRRQTTEAEPHSSTAAEDPCERE